jgi:hypothetical protein
MPTIAIVLTAPDPPFTVYRATGADPQLFAYSRTARRVSNHFRSRSYVKF